MQATIGIRKLVSQQVSVACGSAQMIGTLVNVRPGNGEGSLWLVVDDQDVFVPLVTVTSLVAA